MPEAKLGPLSALSLGIGGMVGGGIFAVTGLTVELTRGAAPVAFAIAGLVAFLTGYSYWKLTLRYPSEGGTIEFLNRAFGTGLFTGSLNILLCLNYVVLLSIYAFAFGAYGARLGGFADYDLWQHILLSGVIVLLVVVNFFGAELAIRAENGFNAGKLLLLAIFIVVGLSMPMEWGRLSPAEYVAPGALVCGAMVIFLNYEGFELIANAAHELDRPRRTVPIAYLGGVAIVMVVYVLIAMVTVGHMDFGEIASHSDYALSVVAEKMMGKAGFVMIGVAALLATSSAINATFYGSGKMMYVIARSGELPRELERVIRGQHMEGMFIFAGLTLIVANFVPLNAIATMGSAGFLLIFLAVNLANVKLSAETESSKVISLFAAAACAGALGALCWQTISDPETRSQIWILAGMVGISFFIEFAYRSATGRGIHLGRGKARSEDVDSP